MGHHRQVPYVEDRVVHDADAHIMETPDWLTPYLDAATTARLPARRFVGGVGGTGGIEEERYFERVRRQQSDPAYRADDETQLMIRKNWDAPGSFISADRSAALDSLGFQSQLIFNTFDSGYINDLEHRSEPELAYAVAMAHNRAMLDFTSSDRRLLPTCYVPLADFDAAALIASEAVAGGPHGGAAALLVPSNCPKGHSPSHTALDRVWAIAQDAGIPIVFHVGGGGSLINPDYFKNGKPIPPDFHGGAENFRSVDYLSIPGPPMQTLGTMIIDGVLERFPSLKIGVIEQGAIWVPGWMRQMESAFDAFHRHETRLQELSLRPSEYVKRQIRVTPYPTEDVGWIIGQDCEDVVLFSSDYPHVEGGRRPIERFERSLGDASEIIRDKFYARNMIDLMGTALAA